MKTNFLRALAVAGLCLIATGTAPKAFAADDAAKQGPKISSAIAKPMQAAQKALTAQDWKGALDALKEAQANSDLTDYDKYVINYYSGIAYVRTNDDADAATAFTAAAESPAISEVPDDQRSQAIRIAIELQNQMSNWNKVIELGKVADANKVSDPAIYGMLAIAYVNANDYATATVDAQKSVALYKAAGKTPEHSVYQVILLAQAKQHDIQGETKTLETLANLYGEPQDWGNLIDIALGTLQTPNKGNRELAALFLFRLRIATKAETSGDDYLLASEVAMGLNSPGDAQASLQAGLASGKLSQDKAAPALAKANARARGDEASLGAAEKAASKEKTNAGAVSVAEGYFGYGRYADAARVAQLAIAKGGPKTLEAQMLLGCAQAMEGDDATATQTLAQVKGDPALESAAHLWTLYATRAYGKTAAAPAATPAAH